MYSQVDARLICRPLMVPDSIPVEQNDWKFCILLSILPFFSTVFSCEATKDSIWFWFYYDHLPAVPDIKPGDLLIECIRGGEISKCIITAQKMVVGRNKRTFRVQMSHENSREGMELVFAEVNKAD